MEPTLCMHATHWVHLLIHSVNVHIAGMSNPRPSKYLEETCILRIMQECTVKELLTMTAVCKQWKGVGRYELPRTSRIDGKMPSGKMRLSSARDQPSILARSSLDQGNDAGKFLFIGTNGSITVPDVKSHVIPFIRLCTDPKGVPVGNISIHMNYSAMSEVMQAVSGHLSTCHTLSLQCNDWFTPNTEGCPVTELLTAFLPQLQRVTTLRFFGDIPRKCVDMLFINSLSNITSLTLQNVIVDNAELVHLPHLTSLSLTQVFLNDLDDMLLRHKKQLRTLFINSNTGCDIDGGLANSTVLPQMIALESLELPCVQHTVHLAQQLNNMPSLTNLDLMSIHGPFGLSPYLTRVRTRAVSGTLEAQRLTHFELLLTHGCHAVAWKSPWCLPSSVTAAHLPRSQIKAAASCSDLVSLSWYSSDKCSANYEDLGEEIDGLWPDLRRVAFTPDCFDTWFWSHYTENNDLVVLEKLIGSGPCKRPLTDVTVMLVNSSSDRLIALLCGIDTLQRVILVNMPITLTQLQSLAGLPVLTHIQLTCTIGATADDCIRVCRREEQDGRCGLTVTLEPDLKTFSYFPANSGFSNWQSYHPGVPRFA